MIEVKRTCPFGHTCEKVTDNKIERCQLYIDVEGENPQTGEFVKRWDCALAWQPILLIETARQTSGMAASMDSFRNETTKRQDRALDLVKGHAKEIPAGS